MPYSFAVKKPAAWLFIAVVGLIISGCATTEQGSVKKILPNPEIVQATIDLEEARESGALWIVRDPALDNKPVSLDKMLQRASLLHDSQQVEAASALASRVSYFARLGIQQALAEADAGPYYPQ